MWGKTHIPPTQSGSQVLQLNEIAFAVREATTEIMYKWKELYSLHNKRLFWRQLIKTIHPFYC
jgi:hypothetical protein